MAASHVFVESRMLGNGHVRFGGRRRGNPQPKGRDGTSPPTLHLPLPAEAASHLFQVVSRRYEQGSIILTTNRGIASWGEIFDDQTVATAILDRLLHHGTVLTINGPSYRMRRHQARLETLRAGLQAPKTGD